MYKKRIYQLPVFVHAVRYLPFFPSIIIFLKRSEKSTTNNASIAQPPNNHGENKPITKIFRTINIFAVYVLQA